MKKTLVCFAALGLLVSCNSKVTLPEANCSKPISISPTITKVTETSFEQGDVIGLTIIRESGDTWAENARLTHDGSNFSGELYWYAGNEPATLKAYCPYSEAFPSVFSVSTDQRGGTSSSDFVAAIKEDVVPGVAAVPMHFLHKFCRIVMNIDNQSGSEIEGVSLGGSIPTATISDDFQIGVADAASADIKAYKVSDTQYRLITVPQTVAFTVKVLVGGQEKTGNLASVDIKSGMEYRVNVKVYDSQIQVVLSGDIDNWESAGEIPEAGAYAVPEAIDLGLSVKWASFNLGATKPEEYGDYFAWGETEPYYISQDPLVWKDGKTEGYDWAYYKWCQGTSSTLTKYNTDSSRGNVDNKTVLDSDDDAAHVVLGGSWRMPTDDEWTELRENCTWEWTSDYNGTGQCGIIVTSNIDGYTDKGMFLPPAGRRKGTNIINAGYYGYYLSSSLNTDITYDVFDLRFYSGEVYRGEDAGRFVGRTIRPVTE